MRAVFSQNARLYQKALSRSKCQYFYAILFSGGAVAIKMRVFFQKALSRYHDDESKQERVLSTMKVNKRKRCRDDESEQKRALSR